MVFLQSGSQQFRQIWFTWKITLWKHCGQETHYLGKKNAEEKKNKYWEFDTMHANSKVCWNQLGNKAVV